MRKNITILLQVIIVALGVSVLTFMLWEPHLEGRNANATLFEIYFKDPFLAYVYIASLPLFIALYKAFKVLTYVKQNKTSSKETMKALRTIKYCAVALIGLVAAPITYLFIEKPGDDIAGGVAIGIFIITTSVIVATAAAKLHTSVQRKLAVK